MNSDNGRIGFSLGLDDSDLRRQINAVVAQFGRMGDVVEEEGGRMDSTFSRLARSLSGIAAGWSVKEFTAKVAQVRGEFQQLEIAFETMLGSGAKANALMSQLTHTAAVTPFDLQGVASGAKQLLAYGTAAEEVNETLTRLGDIASGLSIPLGDMVYLYGTTMTQGRLYTQDLRQFMGRGIPLAEELANQFGVAKDEVGELVTAGKVGAEEVKKAIWNMTNEGSKFGGLMEKQSASITGQISNLEDAVDMMFNDIGKASQGAITTAISGVSTLIENYEEVGTILASIATAYGTYKAAIAAVAVAQRVNITLLRQAVVEKKLAAAASITLSNAEAIAAARGKLLATVQRSIINSFKGAGAALTNPYVLLASAVGAAVYTLYKVATYESKAEKAAKELAKAHADATAEIATETAKIDELFGTLQGCTEGTDEYKDAKQAIIDQYGDYLKGTSDEISSLRDVEAAYKAVTSAVEESAKARAMSAYTEKATTTYGETYGDAAERIRTALMDKYGSREGLEYFTRLKPLMDGKADISSLDADLQKVISSFTKTYGGYSDNYGSSSSYSTNTIESNLAAIAEARNTLSETLQQARDIFGNGEQKSETSTKTQTTLSQDIATARKEWETAKAELNKINADKANYTTQQYKDAVEREETARKAYKDLGGVTESGQSERLKSEEDLNDALKNLELKNQQEEIALMKEGAKKQLAEIKQSYTERESEIQKLESDFAKKNKSAGTAGLNINGLTSGQQSAINQARVLNTRTMSKSIADLYKEPLSRYQDYTDKRLAIEQKYNDDIALLEEARKQAQERGDADQLTTIERSIAKAKTEKAKELLANDYDVLKESPEYVRAFEDLKNTSSETLTYLLGEFERLKGAAAEALNPKDLKEYTDAIQSIMDELDSRDPFKALADRQQELVASNKRLSDAKKNLDAVRNGEKVVKGYKIEDNKIVAEYLSEAEALDEYNKALDEANKASNKYSKAENEVLQQINELAGAVSSLGSAIGGQTGDILSMMGTVSTCVTTTIQGISNVSKTGANAMSTLEKASVILAIFSTIVRTLKTIASLGNNASFKQYEEYAAKLDEINALTAAVSDYKIAVTEARQAEDEWFSDDSLRSLRNYKELHDEIYNAYLKKAYESQAIYQNKSGGGWITGAVNWMVGNLSVLAGLDAWKELWGQKYAEGQTAAINNLRIETRKASSGFLGTGIGGKSQKTQDLQSWINEHADKFVGLDTNLFDADGLVNTELAKSIIDNFGDKLVGQTKETLEELIELKDKYDEYMEQLHEYVSSLYEPLVDNFVDSMWDWFDEGKDALSSFKEYAADTFKDIVSDMMKTIVLEKVVGTFSDDIASIYEDYASGKVSEETLMQQVSEKTGEMISRYEDNIPTLQNILTTVDGYLEKSGIDLNDSATSQSSSTKGFQTMSQDSADELNGRFTSIQMDTNAIRSLVQEISTNASVNNANMATIKASTDAMRDNIAEMRNLSLIGIDHLEAISKNTHELYEMNERLGKIEKNTRSL